MLNHTTRRQLRIQEEAALAVSRFGYSIDPFGQYRSLWEDATPEFVIRAFIRCQSFVAGISVFIRPEGEEDNYASCPLTNAVEQVSLEQDRPIQKTLSMLGPPRAHRLHIGMIHVAS